MKTELEYIIPPDNRWQEAFDASYTAIKLFQDLENSENADASGKEFLKETQKLAVVLGLKKGDLTGDDVRKLTTTAELLILMVQTGEDTHEHSEQLLFELPPVALKLFMEAEIPRLQEAREK